MSMRSVYREYSSRRQNSNVTVAKMLCYKVPKETSSGQSPKMYCIVCVLFDLLTRLEYTTVDWILWRPVRKDPYATDKFTRLAAGCREAPAC
jgi:hypothetical protein